MISNFIKFLFIILCSTLSTFRILNKNIKETKPRIFLLPLALSFNAFVACMAYKFITPFSLLIMVLLSIFIHRFILRQKGMVTVTSTIIGYGISYTFFSISAVIFTTIATCFIPALSELSPVSFLIIGFFQTLLTVLLFCVKRLRHGLPFLFDSKYDDIGVYVSIAFLLITSFRLLANNNFEYAAFTFLILTFIILLILWIHTRMKQAYLNHQAEKEVADLQHALSLAEDEINSLKTENEIFSKIIHKDNKLLPALEMAVEESILSMFSTEDPDMKQQHAQAILARLRTLSAERSEVVANYEHTETNLPKTGFPVLDALFSYFFHKAKKDDITLNIKLNTSMDQIIPNLITEKHCETLLADLIENAIIATRLTDGEKMILLEIARHENGYAFVLYDSGIPFPQEVLKNLGTKRITSHKDTGGSGIGIMSTFEICKRFHASFILSSSEPNSSLPYTKCLEILFDGKNETIISESLYHS